MFPGSVVTVGGRPISLDDDDDDDASQSGGGRAQGGLGAVILGEFRGNANNNHLDPAHERTKYTC